ncbi:MAG: hypothetical protein K2V38_25295, partial [Gemmataceae bacterium]|nr:hypothetical protein [Gemmataceae bacterium]
MRLAACALPALVVTLLSIPAPRGTAAPAPAEAPAPREPAADQPKPDLLSVGLGGTPRSAPQPDQAGIEFFEKKIRPALDEHCAGCHSAAAEKNKKLKGAL